MSNLEVAFCSLIRSEGASWSDFISMFTDLEEQNIDFKRFLDLLKLKLHEVVMVFYSLSEDYKRSRFDLYNVEWQNKLRSIDSRLWNLRNFIWDTKLNSTTEIKDFLLVKWPKELDDFLRFMETMGVVDLNDNRFLSLKKKLNELETKVAVLPWRV